MNKWLRLSDFSAEDKAVRLDIYDQIGEKTDFWTGETKGIAAAHFSAVLDSLPSDTGTIELHINSPGGSLLDAFQIYNELKRHSAKVEVIIDGRAASAASVIAMAGDTVIMPENATLWIHNPVTGFMNFFQGGADDARKQAKKLEGVAGDLEVFTDKIVNTYLAKAGDKIKADQLRALMDAETLITAEQAVEWGLADQIEDQVEISNMAPADQTVREMMASSAAALEAKATEATEATEPQAKATEPQATEPQATEPQAKATEPQAFASPDFAIAACKRAQLQDLALYCIEQKLSESAVTETVNSVGEVMSKLAAANAEGSVSEVAAALKGGPLAMFDFGLQQGALIGSDGDGSELPGTFSMGGGADSQAPQNRSLSANEIYKKRREGK